MIIGQWTTIYFDNLPIESMYFYIKNSNYVNISTSKGGGGVSIRLTFSCTPPGYSCTPVPPCPPHGCPRCVCFWGPPVRHPGTSPGLSWPPHSTSCSPFSNSTKK